LLIFEPCYVTFRAYSLIAHQMIP